MAACLFLAVLLTLRPTLHPGFLLVPSDTIFGGLWLLTFVVGLIGVIYFMHMLIFTPLCDKVDHMEYTANFGVLDLATSHVKYQCGRR